MPQLHTRLTRLEQSRPAKGCAALDLLAPDQATLDAMAAAYADALTSPGPVWSEATFAAFQTRIERMQANGLGLDSLSDCDLALIVAAGDAARGRA